MAQWVLIPLSMAAYNLALPTFMGISWDACAVVSLFVSISLTVAALIDEQALHSLFLPLPVPGIEQAWSRFPRWMRGLHWALGFPLLCALFRISDIQISAGDAKPMLPGGSAGAMPKEETAFVFLTLTYLTAVYCLRCAEAQTGCGQKPSWGLVAGASAPALTYLIFVAYVTVRLNSSLLPLIVTTDAAIILTMPLLHAVVLSRLRGDESTASREARRHAAPEHLRRTLPSAPLLSYGACLCTSWCLAPPRTVAVLLTIAPTRMLAAGQDVLAFEGLPGELFYGLLQAWGKLLNVELRMTVGDLVFPATMAALSIICCWSLCPHRAPAAGPSAASLEAAARRRLTKLRAASKQFPPPFPNGWYHLVNSEDVPVGKAVAASACNKEFAVFRGADGQVAVLHAFCPHLGTHLGHGGQVVGNTVVCPYHSWAFDGKGKCVDIPYCSKQPGEKTHTKAYPCRERLGFIFVWLHADGAEPEYELTLLDEIEENGMQFVTEVPVKNWQMHNMEPSQNAADPYHFNTVHKWLGAKDMEGSGGWMWVRHECKSRLALLGHTEKDGSPIPDNVIHIDEKCVEMWLFGFIPVPSFFNAHYSSGASFQGPQVSVFRIDTKALGSCRIVFTFTPEAPFEQRTTVRVFRSRGFPRFLAAKFGKIAVATVDQDRIVWEHKLAVAPRNVVAGDGPFAAYGTWLRQFYSSSSQTWGDVSLEW